MRYNGEWQNLRFDLYTYLVGTTVFLVSWIVLRTSLKLKEFGKRIDKIPGPFSLPLLGTVQLFMIPRTEILETLVKWAGKFKGCFKLWLLNEPVIFISSENHLQKILGSKDHVEKSDIYGVLTHLLGKGSAGGLITADASSWKFHRRMLLHSVNGKMADIFMDICNDTLNVFEDILNKEPSVGNSKLKTNLHPIVNRLAFDVICEAIFGKSQETLKNSSTHYLNTSFKNKVVCSKRWFDPWLRWEWLWKIHPLRKYEQAVVDVANELFNSVIGDRRNQRLQLLDVNTNELHEDHDEYKLPKRVGRGALIDTLLDAQQDPANDISDEYIQNELMTFLVAGHDTSAETILWAFFLLGNHLDLQEKVHEELVQIFGDNKHPVMTLGDLQKMTYLDQCIKETLRFYPSVPLFVRKVHTDVELEPGLIIPSGADVAVSVKSVHQNPDVYPNPKEFNPDRFTPENVAKRHPYAFCPFSLGPRNCIGKRLGEVLTKSVLARFFLNFTVISLKKPHEVKTVAEVTLGPSKPLYFCVKRR